MTDNYDDPTGPAEPFFELPASAADPAAYREALAQVRENDERLRSARGRRAAWEADVNAAVSMSLASVLSQRHSPMLGPLPRQRERARHSLTAAVGKWFRDVHPTVCVDDFYGDVDASVVNELVGTPCTDPERFPWEDPSIVAMASVLGDGPEAARRAVQNYYLPKRAELSAMTSEQLERHISEAYGKALEAARFVTFDDDRCLRDGQEQK